MYKLLLISCLLLVGCGPHMTNQAIVQETKFCENNGLKANIIREFGDGPILWIECGPYHEDQ